MRNLALWSCLVWAFCWSALCSPVSAASPEAGVSELVSGAPRGEAHSAEFVGSDKVPLFWRSKPAKTDDLPDDWTDQLAAIQAWSQWSQTHGYRMDLERKGRLLLISPKENSGTGLRLKLFGKVWDYCEKMLPTPERVEDDVAGLGGSSDDGEIPEDPEGDEPLFDDVEGAAETYAWGAAVQALDAGTVVFFLLEDTEDYHHLLAELAVLKPYLEDWSEQAKSITGFVLTDPLAGAFLLNAPGMEEWDPDGEYVHRLAHLFILRRFGEQPYWFLKGWAWHCELKIRDGIFCFPYRNEFVGVEEHSGWGPQLRQRWSESKAPTPKDLLQLQRGGWNKSAAGLAWGTVTHMAKKHKSRLSEWLEVMRKHRRTNARITYPDGSWDVDRNWTCPPEEATKLTELVLGAKFFKQLGKALGAGV